MNEYAMLTIQVQFGRYYCNQIANIVNSWNHKNFSAGKMPMVIS